MAPLFLIANANALAQQPIDTIAVGESSFVSAADLAASLNMKLEVISRNNMLTFCSAGPEAICIPLRLTDTNSLRKKDAIFLQQSTVESILSVSVSVNGNSAIATPQKAASPVDLTEGYNSAWAKGRGFNLGETVPDIPLVGMEGEEVRFSEYLGKRYILYCWASW